MPYNASDSIIKNAGVDGAMLYLIERDQSLTRRTWRLRAQTPEGEVEMLTAASNLLGSYGVFDKEGKRVAAMQSNWTGTKYRCFEVDEVRNTAAAAATGERRAKRGGGA